MKRWAYIVIIFLIAVASFSAGYGCRSMRSSETMPTDTVILRDTLRDSIPYPVVETLVQEVPELVPFYITLRGDTVRDTVYLPVAITQKEYRTDSYRAWVSGFHPALDSIWVYPERIYIKEKARRWGIGLSAGYGVGRNGLSPYVGVGVYYRIW